MVKQQLHRTKKNNKDNNKSSENVPLTEHNTLKEKYESLMIYQINLQKDSQSSKEIARHLRVFWRKIREKHWWPRKRLKMKFRNKVDGVNQEGKVTIPTCQHHHQGLGGKNNKNIIWLKTRKKKWLRNKMKR